MESALPRLLADIARRKAEFDAAHARELGRLNRALEEGIRPAVQAAKAAAAATNPGHTARGTPLAERALAGWEGWTDLTAATASFGTGGLVRLGILDAMQVPGGERQELVALVPLLCRGNLLLAGAGAALETANDALQAVLFRLLGVVQPGKLRVTAIDATGLGSTFAELLQLAEGIRGPKVWHEEREIGEALVELTSHMAMVIQKYLRNDFASIDEYNRAAGEVAEPYRVLLVGGFPNGFRPEVAERLLSVAKNGPPLGVHVLLSLDTAAVAPQGFSTGELERHATVLKHRQGGWEWKGAPRPAEVTLDGPPPHSLVASLARTLNPLAAQAGVVRVPLAPLLDPAPWTGSTASGIELPLGRQGARDALLLRFGLQGTAHHALIGGRTGSGKTVLLHAMIASLAWRYAPEEAELYLVDFKEGVEFQVYRDLPHARVVAIQSEREFGLSVLEGLRAELNRRGDLFRARGVDDLSAWRHATGERLPRILLVVDEFQVYFEVNDSLSHQARALLSDVASRGRGFGIHVVLASQTLSAMELDARALSQIGVRVALQMSEADSYKVLGKDNDAARYLERPGEAVFNEAGGQPAHNVRFQVAMISREEREARVTQVRALADARGDHRRPILFEGNRPAALVENRAFAALTPAATTPRGYDVYLGEPTTLQDRHTWFRLRRQARGSLLLVGNDEPAAFATFDVAVRSVTAQIPDGRVLIANLTNVDDPLHDLFERFEALRVPATVRRGPGVDTLLAEAGAELARRREQAASGVRGELPPPWIVGIFGLQRARGFEKQGLKAPPAAATLLSLLNEGPDLGIHVFVWVDTSANLAKVLSSAEIAEFGARVALTAGDALRVFGGSAPASGTLRRGSALLYTEDEPDRLQKFRVYAP